MQGTEQNTTLASGHPLFELRRMVEEQALRSSLTIHATQDIQIAEREPIG